MIEGVSHRLVSQHKNLVNEKRRKHLNINIITSKGVVWVLLRLWFATPTSLASLCAEVWRQLWRCQPNFNLCSAEIMLVSKFLERIFFFMWGITSRSFGHYFSTQYIKLRLNSNNNDAGLMWHHLTIPIVRSRWLEACRDAWDLFLILHQSNAGIVPRTKDVAASLWISLSWKLCSDVKIETDLDWKYN